MLLNIYIRNPRLPVLDYLPLLDASQDFEVIDCWGPKFTIRVTMEKTVAYNFYPDIALEDFKTEVVK